MTCDVLCDPLELRIYKGEKSGYNIIYPLEEKEIMNKAKRWFKRHRRTIQRAVETQITTYAPLEFKPTLKGFIDELQADDFKVLREMSAGADPETFLDESVKDFLIVNAYSELEGEYIRRILMNKLNISETGDVRLLEIEEFVKEQLEKDDMRRLKHFQGRARFKTFLTTAVIRLLYDFWRRKRTVEQTVTKYGPDFDAMFDPPVDDPYSVLVQSDDEAHKQQAAALLPKILAALDPDERLVIKLKYEKDMKLSNIHRTLGTTRYKAEQLIQRVEGKISEALRRQS